MNQNKGEEKEKKKKKNTGDTKRTARYVIFMDSFYIFSVFSPGSVCFCPLEYAHSWLQPKLSCPPSSSSRTLHNTTMCFLNAVCRPIVPLLYSSELLETKPVLRRKLQTESASQLSQWNVWKLLLVTCA